LQLYVNTTQDTSGARLNECEAPVEVLTANIPKRLAKWFPCHLQYLGVPWAAIFFNISLKILFQTVTKS